MEIYKNKVEYEKRNWIHIQTVNNREKIWRLIKLTVNGIRVGYIDVYETNVVLAQQINLLNNKQKW